MYWCRVLGRLYTSASSVPQTTKTSKVTPHPRTSHIVAAPQSRHAEHNNKQQRVQRSWRMPHGPADPASSSLLLLLRAVTGSRAWSRSAAAIRPELNLTGLVTLQDNKPAMLELPSDFGLLDGILHTLRTNKRLTTSDVAECRIPCSW